VEAKDQPALKGLRVLELADEKGVYCGKLLADMGADVIKVEPPGGDSTRALPPFWRDQPDPAGGLFFLYMNTNKRGITLDVTTTEGQTLFRRLSATADVLIETFPPGYLDGLGLGYERLSRYNPGLVVTSITGFGQTGPYRDFQCSDLVAGALGGALFAIGESSDPPVGLAGSQAYVMASTCAAASTMMALHWRLASGVGQHVDISVEETTLAVTHIAGVSKWLDDGILPRRMGTALFASVPSGAYRCKDGLVYLMVNRPLHWKTLAEWVAEVTDSTAILDPLFEGPSSNRQPDRDLLDVYISDLTARFTVEEFYREGQRRHLAVTPVNTARAVARDPHLATREYFVEVEHRNGPLRYPGAAYRFSKTPWCIARPAPAVGEHSAEVFRSPPFEEGAHEGTSTSTAGVSRGKIPPLPPLSKGESRSSITCAEAVTPQALQGLRVVEFTAGMAGPWIGRFMAYCGAEVIKVESQKRPDVTRLYVPPWAPEMGPQTRLSPWFTDWNAGKRFVALDLTRPEAVDLAKRIVAVCDVVVENYAAGVIDKLGLGYRELSRVNPKLVMLSSSGYGNTGPCCRYVTWGPNIEALSGLSKVSGFPHRECTITQYAYPDAVSSLHGLFAVMCGLAHRTRTGEGQYIDLSQYETTVAAIGHVLMEVLANDREPPRLGNRSRHAVPHGCYRCRGEDRWCAISVEGEKEWNGLCRVLGRPEWTDDPRFATASARFSNSDTIDQFIEAWTSERDAYDVMNVLQQAGIAAGVVQTVEDQFRRDPQLAARRFFEEIPHLVKGKVIATGVPIGLTRTPGRTSGTGAEIGQDNEYVFGEVLAMTRAEIQAYVDAGAIEEVATSD
jgi:crotonobetainyl-CoA:carnitine CoA-transferase CaiB-like acyl-CoA transferase